MLLFVVLCIVLCIVAGSKNKKHLGVVRSHKYGPRPSIRPSKLCFSDRIDGSGPYLWLWTAASGFLILLLPSGSEQHEVLHVVPKQHSIWAPVGPLLGQGEPQLGPSWAQLGPSWECCLGRYSDWNTSVLSAKCKVIFSLVKDLSL